MFNFKTCHKIQIINIDTSKHEITHDREDLKMLYVAKIWGRDGGGGK